MNEIGKVLSAVREKAPLVQCITNFVTVNDCANIILAAGGSPSMASDVREIEEAVSGADALVLNIGTVTDTEAMIRGGKQANLMGKPVIFDPVAVGRTQFRKEIGETLQREINFSVIRGNASEIRYLAGQQSSGSGVDVSGTDAVTDQNLLNSAEIVKKLALQQESVVVLSGERDIISDGRKTVILTNGCVTMARITGSGCMLSALIGAFCGAFPQNVFDAAVGATATMGIAGEIAEHLRLKRGTGNASFRTDLIDAVFNMTEKQLSEGIRYEIYEG